MDHTPFELPRVRTLLITAAPRIFEGVVLPLAVFLGALRLVGVTGAVIAGLAVAYLAVGWRIATRRPVPGILVLGALTLTARSVLMLLTGSAVVYFLQPTLSTALVAGALALSVPARRPLAERLARDFCPLPPDVLAHLAIRRFFERITLLWSAVQVLNATVTVWLLATESIGAFVVTKTVVSLALTVGAIGISIVSFQRCMRDHPHTHRGVHGTRIACATWADPQSSSPVATRASARRRRSGSPAPGHASSSLPVIGHGASRRSPRSANAPATTPSS